MYINILIYSFSLYVYKIQSVRVNTTKCEYTILFMYGINYSIRFVYSNDYNPNKHHCYWQSSFHNVALTGWVLLACVIPYKSLNQAIQ
jgi:hypothetical protein